MECLLQNLTSTVNLLPEFGVGLFGYNDLSLEHMENGKAEKFSLYPRVNLATNQLE